LFGRFCGFVFGIVGGFWGLWGLVVGYVPADFDLGFGF
jgi:hypothetical protein